MGGNTILIAVVIFTMAGLMGVSGVTNAQIYFSDSFDNPNESEKKWVDIWGQWEFKDDEYHQLMNDDNCMSLVSDEFWNDDWNEYTFEVRGLKTGGGEGFLIMFRCMGQMQVRGRALREHPPRMKGQPSLQYWWNLGGWANVRSCVERWVGGALIEQVNTAHTIATNERYDIKIVNRPDGYTLYLNGEEIGSMDDKTQDGRGRIGLATWLTTARFDDVIVYGSGGESVEPMGKLAISWARVKSRL